MFYGVGREKADSCFCGSCFSVYVGFETFVFVLLSSLENLWICDFRVWDWV